MWRLTRSYISYYRYVFLLAFAITVFAFIHVMQKVGEEWKGERPVRHTVAAVMVGTILVHVVNIHRIDAARLQSLSSEDFCNLSSRYLLLEFDGVCILVLQIKLFKCFVITKRII